MMKEDLREGLPLWSLDRRGDGRRGAATTSETVGVLYAFGCTGPLGDPLEVVYDAPLRRVPDRATIDRITPLAMIRRILAFVRLRRGRVRSRQELKELDNHLLRDIGLGREAIDYTSPRPEMYWD
jgi:uncharacterized protein YjiS (DUF1127 family)